MTSMLGGKKKIEKKNSPKSNKKESIRTPTQYTSD